MGKIILAIIMLTVLYWSTVLGARARPPAKAITGSTLASSPSEEFLNAHNQARAEVGVSSLKWSQDLAQKVSLTVNNQRDKQNCSFADLNNSKYGGNQLWASGFDVTPRVAVDSWIAEKKFYNYANNSCATGHSCGVYTQVVWRKSLELGCAQASCTKDNSVLTICFYNPPGNIIGEKPY